MRSLSALLPKLPTTQTNTKYNPNPTTKQYKIVNIQLNIVTCTTYPYKFIRGMLLHRLLMPLPDKAVKKQS